MRNVEVAVFDQLVVFARGDETFSVHRSDVGDFYRLLETVLRQMSETAEDNTAVEFDEDHEPTPIPRPVRVGASKTPARRGRIWEAVKQALHKEPEPVPYEHLLQLVSARALTTRNPNHALRICLGKKVSSGELLQTAGGHYHLAPQAQNRASDTPTGRNRPGRLWQGIREYLGQHPDGLSRDALVAAAAEHGWTTAKHVEHAVRICLARVSDQLIELPDNRYALKAAVSQAATTLPTVRRRRRVQKAGNESPTETEAIDITVSSGTSHTQPDTPVFVASTYYPRRKHRG